MADMNVLSQEVLDQLKAAGIQLPAQPQQPTVPQMGGFMAQPQPQSQMTGGFGWQRPQPQVSAEIKGVLIPVEVETSAGKVNTQFLFDASVASTPETLLNTIEGLIGMGVPVKAWQPQQSGGNWGRKSYGGGYRR